MNYPKIRFKGYTDVWEQRKLIEVCDYVDYRGKTPIKTETGIFLVTAKNVKNGYIDYDSSKEYISEEDYEEVMHRGKPEIGDVLITTEAPCGNVAQVNSANIALAQRIIKYRGHDKVVDNTYLKYYLLAPVFQKILTAKSSGGTVQGIKGSILHQQVIRYPVFDEQVRIGQYLDDLNHLITLYQRKCEETKILKKFMLQKMFPQNGTNIPEIRFDGFTDAWEQRKLGELVGVYDGIHQTPEYQDEGIMFLSVEDISTLKSQKYISEEAFERDYKVYPEKGDILMTRIGNVGATNVVESGEKLAFYVSLALLKPNDIDAYFLSNAMKNSEFQKGLRERTLVTAIPQKINKDEIGKVSISVTLNISEQIEIGKYFKNLDRLITLHQQKCDELLNIKKFMLQNMFV